MLCRYCRYCRYIYRDSCPAALVSISGDITALSPWIYLQYLLCSPQSTALWHFVLQEVTTYYWKYEKVHFYCQLCLLCLKFTGIRFLCDNVRIKSHSALARPSPIISSKSLPGLATLGRYCRYLDSSLTFVT